MGVGDPVDPRVPTGRGMCRGIPRAGVLRREPHGSRKLEKSPVGGPAGKGALPAAVEVGQGRVARCRWLFFLRQSLTRLLRPRRKCPERRLSQPIGAGLGDAREGAGCAEGAEGEGGPRTSESGVGEPGWEVRDRKVAPIPPSNTTESAKLTFPSWRGRGEPASSLPQVAGEGAKEAPSPLRKEGGRLACIRRPPQGKGWETGCQVRPAAWAPPPPSLTVCSAPSAPQP